MAQDALQPLRLRAALDRKVLGAEAAPVTRKDSATRLASTIMNPYRIARKD